MALGKSRSSRRSSSSSPYMSTVTMVVFIAFCVLGLWMITSKSVITPQTTTRTSNPIVSLTQTQTPTQTHSHYFPKLIERKEPPAFDDTQGDLPDDAIKGDNTEDHKPNEKKQPLETSKDDFNAQNDKQSVMSKLRDVVAETMTTTTEMEREGNVDSKINTGSTSATEEQKQEKEKVLISEENNLLTQQAKESVVEEEQQQQKQEPQVAEERNAIQQKQQQVEETLENQQIPTNTNAETEENNGNKGQIQQQTVEVLGNNMQHQTHLQVPKTAESSSVQRQTQQDTEIESNNNLHQNLQATEVGQSQQAIEVENNIIQKDPEVESLENPQQSQQLKSEEAHRQETQQDVTEETASDEKKQEHTQQQQQKEIQEVTSDETQQQRLQPEIQEITSDDTQQIHQRQGSQEAQTTTIQQSQQQKTEKDITAVENQKSQQTKGDIHTELNSAVIFPGGAQSVIPKESNTSAQGWLTQADQSENEKERQKEQSSANSKKKAAMYGYAWKLCNVTTGPDYIPCLDNEKAIRQLRYTGHFEHRERHCPEEAPTCLVPIPHGYKRSIAWPASRDKIWYHNVPHKMLAEVKGHQNWVKVTGEFLTFPGGGTQFIHGALHYIDFIQQAAPRIAWGKRTRVVLDVGCGVASFGGYLFERDVLTMSFAPKDEHEAQVQFALERGIPAISAVMGSKRLPFPSRVCDVVHCARCRVPWHREGGALLLELNRVLRPGGYFVWSATPVYQKLKEDVEIWKAMSSLTSSMCWELFTIKKDKVNSIGVAIFRKPFSNECYDSRKHKSPPMCKEDDDPNAAWNVPLQSCMHRVPVDVTERGSQWPENWPRRLHTPPYWLNSSQIGVYGKPAPDDFAVDYKHWKQVVSKSYLNGLGISWSNVRNVMDMRAVYGGFAAALKDLKVWVLNVVNVDSPDTLPIIYERGLFGIYHDWCESFSTYPRTYDLLHTDHLFSRLKKRCKIMPVMTEIDRIVRPGGKLIVRDEPSIVGEVENMLKSMHWEIHLTFAKDQDGILSAQKSDWRPDTHSVSS